jgi:hypothetical protein
MTSGGVGRCVRQTVQDLLPLERHKALFKRLRMSAELVATCQDVVRELKIHTPLTLFTKVSVIPAV